MRDAQPDKRLIEYRQQVCRENSVGNLRVFFGFLGLMVLFILSVISVLKGTETGLLAGGIASVLLRFGKFGFFLACFWGLLGCWSNYSEENARECHRRKEMLARIEQDSGWCNRRGSQQASTDVRLKEPSA
jgi:hypothetical protein